MPDGATKHVTDDEMLLEDAAGSIVEGNTIGNVFDAGIESLELIATSALCATAWKVHATTASAAGSIQA